MENCGQFGTGMHNGVRSPKERPDRMWRKCWANQGAANRAGRSTDSQRHSDRVGVEVSLTPTRARGLSSKARKLQNVSKRTTSWGTCLLRPQDVGVGSRLRRSVDLLVVCAPHNVTSRTKTRCLSSEFELFGPPRVLWIPSDNTGFRAHGCQAPFRRSPARCLSAVERTSSRGVPSGTSPCALRGRRRLESCSSPKAAARQRRDNSQDGLGVLGFGTRVRLDRQSTAHNRLLRVSKFRDTATGSFVWSGAWKQVAPLVYRGGRRTPSATPRFGARDHWTDGIRGSGRQDDGLESRHFGSRRMAARETRTVRTGGVRVRCVHAGIE